MLVAALVLLLALTVSPRAGASVYWSNTTGAAIGRANDDGTAFNPVFVGNVGQPCGVASDGAHVYWADRADRSIARANLDGSGINRHFITGVDSCAALAVDGAHIYWATLNGSIARANLDGTGVDTSFIPNVVASFGVAVDRGHIYWTTSSAVGRANLDGTGANPNFIVVSRQFGLTCGVAVDAGHVYWASALGTIGRANLNGTAREESFVRTAPPGHFTCGVAVDSAHLYWSHFGLIAPDAFNDGIGRANLDGTGVNQTFIPTPAESEAVAVDAATQAAPPSRVAIGDSTTAEGNDRQTAFQFTATLDSPQSSPVTVDFASADGTATAPSDYTATTGKVTFEPGETAKTATVEVNGDTTVEPDETFNVTLTGATGNATIADGHAVATIVNDDPPATPTPTPTPTPTGCSGTNGADVPIADLSTAESPIRISGCPGNASAAATVEVHILHTFIGDLVVNLVAPDGSTYLLHNRAGGGTDNINQTYTVNLSSEPREGTWRLRVQDTAFADVGRIDSWTISL
jgi:hypothetical protein